ARQMAKSKGKKPAKGGAGWDRRDGFRIWGPARALTRIGEHLAEVEANGDRFTVTAAGETITLRLRAEDGALRVDDSARIFTARVVRRGGKVTVFMDGAAHEFAIPDPLAAGGDSGAGGDMVLSPMPGLVKSVAAKPGDTVEQGAPLCVLEAMKMEHTLKAPRGGVIAAVNAAAGDQVEEGAILITLEPEDG
ncbi:MAG: biotin/lipoyl-containing protein, partial [Paracoccaceae bacterium]